MPRSNAKLLSEIEAFNSQWIERYIDTKKKGLAKSTKKKIREKLGKMGRLHLNKRFDQVTKDDLEEWIDNLKGDEIDDPEYPEYSEDTKVTYLKVAKPFFAWMHEQDDPNFASWIVTGNYQITVGPEDLLSDNEKNAIRSVLEPPRDPAMFETLYESFLRPKEFLSLRRSDLDFEKDSIMIHVRKGKTGFPRDVPIVRNARGLLTKWVFDDHPLKTYPDFPLWVDMATNTSHDPLQQQGLRKFIVRIAEQAKIKKRVVPYTLRHTGITDLAKMGANEAILCQLAGWKQGSEVPRHYIHLSGRDTKPALMKIFGIQQQDSEKPIIQLPKSCPNCKEISPTEAKICWKCKMPIDPQTMLQMIQEKADSNAELKKQLEWLKAFRHGTEKWAGQTLQLTPEELGDAFAWAINKKREKEYNDARKDDIISSTQRIKEIESGAPLNKGEIYGSRKRKD